MNENLVVTDFIDDLPVDITEEANFIWSIANKLRGAYMPDKYGDVIIPMTIIRRFECALAKTKDKVVDMYEKNKNYPHVAMCRLAEKQFYNTSRYTLKELCNDPDHLAANFKAYIDGFSPNVQDILNQLSIESHIDKMDKENCLFSVVKDFSELDLSEETFDPIKMGYIFENLIGRFYQNVDAGQFYTGRDIIKMMVSVLTAEGSDDIYDEGKVVTILDQAAGTGGMLSTAYNHIKRLNPTADVRLFGQELMGQSYAVGLAEMLIKGQDARNFIHADTLKDDYFKGTTMRYLLENPPFGTSWGGKNARTGQEQAVRDEYAKGKNSRWPAGLPEVSDAQLIFMQAAVNKLDNEVGRGAIITNGSPLFNGGVSSGESQTRKWLLENDLIEAIIAMPTDLFYNTDIATYVWVISKNKRSERKGFIQLIDAREIYHTLRKPLGRKRKEFTSQDRQKIIELYTNFEENELCQIYPNEEFIYREYTVMQPMQRSYAINAERIENLELSDALNPFYNKSRHKEILEKQALGDKLTKADQNNLKKYRDNQRDYEEIFIRLNDHISDEKYLSKDEFKPVLENILSNINLTKAIFNRIVKGLSEMDKEAEIEYNRKGEIVYDTDTKDTEIVRFDEDIDEYMEKEVLPYIPDAKAFFEEDLTLKYPRIKTGAEIPFTRYFYQYEASRDSGEIAEDILSIEYRITERMEQLFGGD